MFTDGKQSRVDTPARADGDASAPQATTAMHIMPGTCPCGGISAVLPAAITPTLTLGHHCDYLLSTCFAICPFLMCFISLRFYQIKKNLTKHTVGELYSKPRSFVVEDKLVNTCVKSNERKSTNEKRIALLLALLWRPCPSVACGSAPAKWPSSTESAA